MRGISQNKLINVVVLSKEVLTMNLQSSHCCTSVKFHGRILSPRVEYNMIFKTEGGDCILMEVPLRLFHDADPGTQGILRAYGKRYDFILGETTYAKLKRKYL